MDSGPLFDLILFCVPKLARGSLMLSGESIILPMSFVVFGYGSNCVVASSPCDPPGVNSGVISLEGVLPGD